MSKRMITYKAENPGLGEGLESRRSPRRLTLVQILSGKDLLVACSQDTAAEWQDHPKPELDSHPSWPCPACDFDPERVPDRKLYRLPTKADRKVVANRLVDEAKTAVRADRLT